MCIIFAVGQYIIQNTIIISRVALARVRLNPGYKEPLTPAILPYISGSLYSRFTRMVCYTNTECVRVGCDLQKPDIGSNRCPPNIQYSPVVPAKIA